MMAGELLNDSELRRLLHVSRTTLWRLRKRHGLPFGRVGKQYRYDREEVLAWVRRNRDLEQQLRLKWKD